MASVYFYKTLTHNSPPSLHTHTHTRTHTRTHTHTHIYIYIYIYIYKYRNELIGYNLQLVSLFDPLRPLSLYAHLPIRSFGMFVYPPLFVCICVCAPVFPRIHIHVTQAHTHTHTHKFTHAAHTMYSSECTTLYVLSLLMFKSYLNT